jgi:hypothetical protein
MRAYPGFHGNGPNDGFYFEPDGRWYPGEIDDPELLNAVLGKVKGLKPFKDDLGNAHVAFVVHADPDEGFWVVIRKGADWKLVDTAIREVNGG